MKSKHPLCSVAMLCPFELSRLFESLAELPEQDRLLMFKKTRHIPLNRPVRPQPVRPP